MLASAQRLRLDYIASETLPYLSGMCYGTESVSPRAHEQRQGYIQGIVAAEAARIEPEAAIMLRKSMIDLSVVGTEVRLSGPIRLLHQFLSYTQRKDASATHHSMCGSYG